MPVWPAMPREAGLAMGAIAIMLRCTVGVSGQSIPYWPLIQLHPWRYSDLHHFTLRLLLIHPSRLSFNTIPSYTIRSA